MNSLIQAAIAKARGYRNPQNLITMAYLIAGKLEFNNAYHLAGLPTRNTEEPKVSIKFRRLQAAMSPEYRMAA